MALPSSGELGFDDIAAHLWYAQPYNYTCNFQNQEWRDLAERRTQSSLIGISNFHGKWAGTKTTTAALSNGGWGYSDGSTISNAAGSCQGDYAGNTISSVYWVTDGLYMFVKSKPTNFTIQIKDASFNNVFGPITAQNNPWIEWNTTTYSNFWPVNTNVMGGAGTIRWLTWP